MQLLEQGRSRTLKAHGKTADQGKRRVQRAQCGRLGHGKQIQDPLHWILLRYRSNLIELGESPGACDCNLKVKLKPVHRARTLESSLFCCGYRGQTLSVLYVQYRSERIMRQ